MTDPRRRIEAAGGVVWRPSGTGTGVEVCLVHRPKYDDWSLPKGKLNAGEHPLVGARREVLEETGLTAVAGPSMGSIEYLKDGLPKRVRFWSMRARGGVFEANAEVDQLMWLPPREGQQHLCADRDRPVLARFASAHTETVPLLILRHASAGKREDWPGQDDRRPLDDVGRAQAGALADVLDAFAPVRAYSADVLRCLQTVEPWSHRAGVAVASEPLLSEVGAAHNPQAAVERVLAIARQGQPAVICTQRLALKHILAAVFRGLGGPAEAPAMRKAGVLVLHLNPAGSQLIDLDVLEAPASART